MKRLLLSSLALAASTGLAVGQIELSGNISDSTTGPLLSGQVYHLNSTVTVVSNQTLTVQPGAIIKGRPNSHFVIYGELHVDGIAANPVVFTSIADDTVGGDSGGDGASTPSNGDWRGIYMQSTAASTHFHHAEIRYGGGSGYAGLNCGAAGTILNYLHVSNAGGNGIDMHNQISTMTNCTVTDCGTRAVYQVNLQAVPTFLGNSASGNGWGNHEVIGSYSGGAVTIGPENCMGGVLYTPSNITTHTSITLEAGLIVKSSPNVHWVFYGPFIVNGTAQDPVIMTSTADDSYGGDCLNDGATSGSRGDWRGVYLQSTADGSSLSHLQVLWGGASGYSAIVSAGAQVDMDDCTMHGSTSAGLDFNGNDPGSTVTSCTFSNNVHAARNVPIHALPDFSSNSSWGNDTGEYIQTTTYNGTESITITTDNLLSDTLVFTGNMNPATAATLTFEAGVIVKAHVNSHIVMYGALIVNGTAQDPVVFTSLNDDEYGGDVNVNGATSGSPGDWRGMFFQSTADASMLNHAIIRFGGASGYHNIVLTDTDLTMTDCVSEYGEGAGINFSGNTFNPTITNCAFDNNTGTAAINAPVRALMGCSGNTASGNLSNHTHVSNWSVAGGPVAVILDNLIGDLISGPGFQVGTGQTLTLHEGIVVKFDPNSHVVVYGTLNVLGTKGFPVRFTSIRDDYLGDTDGTATLPAHGDWRGLFCQGTATGTVEHLRMSYGGSSGYHGIVNYSSGITFQNIRLEYANGSGYQFHSMSPDTKRLSAYDCTQHGFDLVTGGFQLNHATAYGNAVDGIHSRNNHTGNVTNSISYGNAGVQFEGFNIGEVSYSCGSPTHAGQMGNISVNPGFVNPSNGVLSLFETSPCVDAGDPNSDLDPDLTRADMGAFFFDHCRARTICDGKENSAGCMPTIMAMGTTDHALPDDLVLTASNIPGDRTGFLMWSLRTNPAIAGNPGTVGVAHLGVRRCLFQPSILATVNSGGTPGQCDGSFSVPISHADMLTEGWLPGTTVHVQFLYQDEGQPDGTPWGYSPALIFNICP